jgi:hypothetical protein
MMTLQQHRVQEVGKYIGNRAEGLGKYLDSLQARLGSVTDEAGGNDVVEAVVRAYQASLMVTKKGPRWDRVARRQELADATHQLVELTGRDNSRLLRAFSVLPILANRYRASSAVENFNSVLRPYLVVQKHAEQGFLHLFQFYWNMRTRKWGRGKGSSAYEALTGLKVDDWLTLLGYPPSSSRALTYTDASEESLVAA